MFKIHGIFLFLLLQTFSICADEKFSVESILKKAVSYQNPKGLPPIHTMTTFLDAEMIIEEGDLKTISIKEIFHYPSNILMHLSVKEGDFVSRTYNGKEARFSRDGKKTVALTLESHPKDYHDLIETVRRRKLLIMDQLLQDYYNGDGIYSYIGVVSLTKKKEFAHKISRKDPQTQSEIELFFDTENYSLVLVKMQALEEPHEEVTIQILDYVPITKRGDTPRPGQKYMNYPKRAKIYNSAQKKIGTFYVTGITFGFLDTDIPKSETFEDPTLPFPK